MGQVSKIGKSLKLCKKVSESQTSCATTSSRLVLSTQAGTLAGPQKALRPDGSLVDVRPVKTSGGIPVRRQPRCTCRLSLVSTMSVSFIWPVMGDGDYLAVFCVGRRTRASRERVNVVVTPGLDRRGPKLSCTLGQTGAGDTAPSTTEAAARGRGALTHFRCSALVKIYTLNFRPRHLQFTSHSVEVVSGRTPVNPRVTTPTDALSTLLLNAISRLYWIQREQVADIPINQTHITSTLLSQLQKRRLEGPQTCAGRFAALSPPCVVQHLSAYVRAGQSTGTSLWPFPPDHDSSHAGIAHKCLEIPHLCPDPRTKSREIKDAKDGSSAFRAFTEEGYVRAFTLMMSTTHHFGIRHMRARGELRPPTQYKHGKPAFDVCW
ncbi:hypothetical protein Bbelb_145330 [Branchiostoma belcheri]|nr:hypothetical protein Bbelb_145330 [Branchiostoma belcheri]